MIKKLVLLICVIAIVTIITSCVESSIEVGVTGEENLPSAEAVSGNTITIADCKADPNILQVNDGTEITFVNSDSQDHTLSMALPDGVQEISLPSNGNTKFTANSPTGTQITLNYLCDQKTLPYGGAIFII